MAAKCTDGLVLCASLVPEIIFLILMTVHLFLFFLQDILIRLRMILYNTLDVYQNTVLAEKIWTLKRLLES